MPSTKYVHDTHISPQKVRQLHEAMIDIVTFMNQPQRDEQIIQEAAIALDGALFPLLVGIERRGPLGIVELAEGTGRDYTTVSRQVTKLESLGLAERRQNDADRRVNQVVVTSRGKALTDKIDAAREKRARAIFENWTEDEFHELLRLMTRFSASLKFS